jgi:hypothetical protein
MQQKIDYKTNLEQSYQFQKQTENPDLTRLGFLAGAVFDLTTYDAEMDDFFGRKAVEVCFAITHKKTFEYIKDPENYKWYLIMCNLPFFAERLEWGSSIRSAWWATNKSNTVELSGHGFVDQDGKQYAEQFAFTLDQWNALMLGMIEFVKPEVDLTQFLA